MVDRLQTTIGQQITLQRGFDITKAQQREGNVPVVSSGGIASYHDVPAAEGPGVVIGRKGVVGSVFYMPGDYWPHDTTLWVKDFHGNDPRYVYYFLRSLIPKLKSLDVGSANPTLNRNHVHPIEILWPNRQEQIAIAGILGTLDDKIENNHKMSATVEAVARTLFKSWFVDFDPVRSKAENLHTRLSPQIATMFPDSLEQSQIGEMPKGWTIKAIGDIADVVGGSTPKTSDSSYWDGPYAWATPKDLAGLSTSVLLSTQRTITEDGLSKVSSGLLPVGTILLSSRAPIGYLAVAHIPVAVNQGFIAMKARPGTSNLFVLEWTKSAHDKIVARANGSTFLEISKTNFRPIPIVVPSDRIMQTFDNLVRPLHERLVVSERESRSLVGVRAALLPKLISGQLRVNEAERILENTA